MSETVVLEMTPETARIVARACEFYSKVRNGNYRQICYELMFVKHDKVKYDLDKNYIINHTLDFLKHLTHPDLPSYVDYGVKADHDCDVAWETYTTIRHALAWHEHPEGGLGVAFYEPMSYSGEEMPKCKVVEE